MHLYHFRSITQTLYGIMNIIVMLNNYCIQLKLHWENAVISSQLTSYSVFFDTTRVDQIILQRQLSNYNNFI
jgi:hypothetical protein